MLRGTGTYKGRASQFDVDLTRSERSSERRLGRACQAHSSFPTTRAPSLLARFHKGRKGHPGINEGRLDVNPFVVIIQTIS